MLNNLCIPHTIVKNPTMHPVQCSYKGQLHFSNVNAMLKKKSILYIAISLYVLLLALTQL